MVYSLWKVVARLGEREEYRVQSGEWRVQGPECLELPENPESLELPENPENPENPEPPDLPENPVTEN